MPISERDYMRAAGNFARRPFAYRWTWTTTRIIVTANAAVFVLQNLVALFGASAEATFLDWFALSSAGLGNGFFWTLLTHSFLHSGFWHFLLNMILLWFAARHIEKTEGRTALLTAYFGGVFTGAVCWLALAAFAPPAVNAPIAICIGASAGVYACVTNLLIKNFNNRMPMLIFIIPVVLRAKWLLAILAGFALLGLFASEIPFTTHWWGPLWEDDGVGHSAHLGGMMWGAALLARTWWRARQRPTPHRRGKVIPFKQTVTILDDHPAPQPDRVPQPVPFSSDFTTDSIGTATIKTPAQPARTTGAENILRTPPLTDALRTEVNRILDKINVSGFASLTRAERDTLERASAAFDTPR